MSRIGVGFVGEDQGVLYRCMGVPVSRSGLPGDCQDVLYRGLLLDGYQEVPYRGIGVTVYRGLFRGGKPGGFCIGV